MTFLQAIFTAIFQGVTELFPVSSLGHAVILPAVLGWISPAFGGGLLGGSLNSSRSTHAPRRIGSVRVEPYYACTHRRLTVRAVCVVTHYDGPPVVTNS